MLFHSADQPNPPSTSTPRPEAHEGGMTPDLLAEANAAMNAAMSGMPSGGAGAAKGAKRERNVKPIGGPAPAPVRGPRVVQAGREHRTGRVVSVGPTDLFVEFGPKELGVVPRAHWKEEEVPTVGAEVEVVIDKFEAGDSVFICSRPGVVQKAEWELLEAGQVVEARVTGVSKGGLECEVAHHRAFIPASQVGLERIENFEPFVGEKLACKVVRVERMGAGNIVLSRREVLAEERKRQVEKMKETLAEGQVLEGTVRKIMPFGAFVDIGGVDGLVHLSDLTYDRLSYGEKAVEKVVKEGDKVRVQVLKLDWENDRISLGMKQVQGDPFQTAINDIREGADIGGRVVRIAEFGAFVQLAPGVEGLVHISELDHRRVSRVEDVLKVDEVVQARVLKIDPQGRKISLSIKALKPLPQIELGGGGKGKRRDGGQARSPEEIAKETPAMRRLREKTRQLKLKGGLG